MIINGIDKVFANKIRRRNLNFICSDNLREIKIQSIRNRALRLQSDREGLWLEFDYERHKFMTWLLARKDLTIQHLKRLFAKVSTKKFKGSYAVNLPEGEVYLDGESMERYGPPIERFVSESRMTEFRVLTRDSLLLSQIIETPHENIVDNVFTTTLIVGLMVKLLDESFATLSDERNLVNKCFITLGGLLRECIERA